jgi:hypothetical protein
MKFILSQSVNYLNKKHKQHMKFATTIANTSTCGGIVHLKLPFYHKWLIKPTKLAYNYNFKKLMQRETIVIKLWGASIKCQYYGDKDVWLVKQPLI